MKHTGLSDHPKDAKFLNTLIRFYTEMETIFGSSMAAGRFSLCSSEPLEVNNVDNVAAKIEGHGFTLLLMSKPAQRWERAARQPSC
jgi:hypothetical protein